MSIVSLHRGRRSPNMSFGVTDVSRLAAMLADEPVTSTTLAARGGNSRVFKVQTASGVTAALKLYPPGESSQRLAREYAALAFLSSAGVAIVPKPLAQNTAERAALYTWIDGDSVREPGLEDIGQLADFLAVLHGFRSLPEAQTIGPAAEAVTSAAELARQVQARIERLAVPAHGDPKLARILEAIREVAAERSIDDWTPLSPDRQTLSPSDIGFHNALRRGDGSLAFLDFEFFGWDDPVKLVSDLLWHPGHSLGSDLVLELRRRTAEIYSADGDFEARLAAFYPFFGLRWALIVLNEFLPDGRRRRAFAGGAGLESEERQLAKARIIVERVRECPT